MRHYPLGILQLKIIRVLGSMPGPISTSQVRDYIHWVDAQDWKDEMGTNPELKKKRKNQRSHAVRSLTTMLRRGLLTKEYKPTNGHTSAMWELTERGKEVFRTLNYEILEVPI